MKFRMVDHRRKNWIRDFQDVKQVCLTMYCVCMCFDLTSLLPTRKEISYGKIRTHTDNI